MKRREQEILKAFLNGRAEELEVQEEEVQYVNSVENYLKEMQKLHLIVQDTEWGNDSLFHVIASILQIRQNAEGEPYTIDNLREIAVEYLRNNIDEFIARYPNVNHEFIDALEAGNVPADEIAMLAIAEALNVTFYIYDLNSRLEVVNPGFNVFFIGLAEDHYINLLHSYETLYLHGLVYREESNEEGREDFEEFSEFILQPNDEIAASLSGSSAATESLALIVYDPNQSRNKFSERVDDSNQSRNILSDFIEVSINPDITLPNILSHLPDNSPSLVSAGFEYNLVLSQPSDNSHNTALVSAEYNPELRELLSGLYVQDDRIQSLEFDEEYYLGGIPYPSSIYYSFSNIFNCDNYFGASFAVAVLGVLLMIYNHNDNNCG